MNHSTPPITPPIARFPWVFVACICGLIVLLIVGLTITAYNAYQAQQSFRALESELRELRGEILSLNTELGLSVQLAVSTQNPIWETRHRLLKSKLNADIDRAVQLAPKSKRELQELDDAHHKIAEIETFIFSLVSLGESQESHVLLSSEEYKLEQDRYGEGLKQFSLSLEKQAESLQFKTKRTVLGSVFIAAFCAISLLLIVAVILERWKKTVAVSQQILREKEVVLSKINRDLEIELLERKKLEVQLEEQAIHDLLTGLYNRRYFNKRCAEEMAVAKRSGRSFAILLCDLDCFKAVNDTFGHPVGDEILKSVAKSVKDALREVDLVFRWGGDEFIVILPDTSGGSLLSIAERIRKKVRSYNEKSELAIDISIGAAFYPDSAKTMDELIGVVDRALYFSKKTQTHFHIGDAEYKVDSHAIDVVFQPIWDIRTDRVLGYEALSRDPKGKLSILELFKRYEAIGQLRDLKALCFKEQLKIASDRKIDKLFLNVDFDLLSYLGKVSKPSDIDVFLEISELEALSDVQRDLELVKEWRADGYQFVIDDFGAGYISFSFLANLAPSHIKINRSVITQAVSSPKFRTFFKYMVEGLQSYAASGLVVEGIETAEELEVVQSMNLFLVQGFLLGRPQAKLVGDKTNC